MKNGMGSFKIFLKNHKSRRAHFYRKAFWCNIKSNFFRSWSLGVWRDHNRVKHVYNLLQWEKSFKNFSRDPWPNKFHFFLQVDLMQSHVFKVKVPERLGPQEKKSNFACVYMGNISQYDSSEWCGPWASCFYRHE
jgi:hypothetical protein